MIYFDESKQNYVISTKNSTLVLHEGSLCNLYWGGSIDAADLPVYAPHAHSSFDSDLNAERSEFPIANGRLYTESCLDAGDNGQGALFFKVQDHQIADNSLVITLFEPTYALTLTLTYIVYDALDIVARSAMLRNDGEDITLRRFFSGSCNVPANGQYHLMHLAGKWAGECQIQKTQVNPGTIVLQAKRGISGPHFNPTFALYEDAEEACGEVWFGALAYSGNWKICVESTAFGNTHVLAGRSDFDAQEILKSGETITAPVFYTGYSNSGFGGMSHRLHTLQTQYLCKRKTVSPVLYNSWEATAFDVRCASQIELAKKAAQMGVELFVVDDGWFGARNSDRAGLGDWYVNTEKFPQGLAALIDAVKALGMKFGIWVEPEAVNPDSHLYRAHPDWVYHLAQQPPMTARNQYVLDFSLPAVRTFVKDFLKDLLDQYEISYLKWDMNRPITDVQSIAYGNGKKRRGHIEGLYEIWRWLRAEYPQVELESCSGGGGRVDLGILEWAGSFWPSDNTDPCERLFIQEGFTQFYAPGVMDCWVTDTPEHGGRAGRCALSYKFHSAMCGALGIGADISLLNDTLVAQYREWIALYKRIRKTIQFGRLDRLLSPKNNLSAVQYYGEKQVVVFLFLQTQPIDRPLANVRLHNLLPDKHYRLQDGNTFSGKTLMHYGIKPTLSGDFDSACLIFEEVES